MRLGVLDVGSNTVHLLVVDAHRGAEPTPQHSDKSELRLAEHIDKRGNLIDKGADALVRAVADARKQAHALHCDELLAFATSAVRDASNSDKVLRRVERETGVELQVLTGEDEARLTFLAVRRWLGWSAGNLISLDIGGGSLELAAGGDEDPEVALSLPLGAARLTREHFTADPPGKDAVAELRELPRRSAGQADPQAARRGHARSGGRDQQDLPHARPARRRGAELGRPARLPRCSTATVSGRSPLSSRGWTPSDLAELDGVSPARAHQTLAGAVVAAAAMDALDVEVLELCPWALREGIILRRLDWLSHP